MIDRYTKVLFTVIAAALVAIVAQNAVGTLRMAICDVDNPNACARVTTEHRFGYTVLLTGEPYTNPLRG